MDERKPGTPGRLLNGQQSPDGNQSVTTMIGHFGAVSALTAVCVDLCSVDRMAVAGLRVGRLVRTGDELYVLPGCRCRVTVQCRSLIPWNIE